MDWKIVTENILELKNLADNEEIKSKLESLSLYNCWLKQILDGEENGEMSAAVAKENELKDNTTAKIYELQEQARQAQNPEEEASKIIECFLYIDNYLCLYCEPELFFVQPQNKLQIYDSVELLNSKKKFDDILQSMFFFQELNTKSHISIPVLCNFLRESKTNITELIDKMDYVMDRLDALNDTVFGQKQNDGFLKQLYPFILIINFTAQKLMIHRFTYNYPPNLNKTVFLEALKQKEHVLDRIKGKIIKRASVIKQLKGKISEPMNQNIWFDQRCVEVYDEEIVAKRETPEEKGESASLIITTDKINRCCEASYWTAFLMTNDSSQPPNEANAQAQEWLDLYFAASKARKYDAAYSLRKFLMENHAETVKSFNNIKIKPAKKEKGPSLASKVLPLWLVAVVTVVICAIFIFFIVSSGKSIIP